jgi:hypothetical protein
MAMRDIILAVKKWAGFGWGCSVYREEEIDGAL